MRYLHKVSDKNRRILSLRASTFQKYQLAHFSHKSIQNNILSKRSYHLNPVSSNNFFPIININRVFAMLRLL